MNRQIVAMGGGGYSTYGVASGLDSFVLERCGKAKPRVCLIPTASGENRDAIIKFYETFSQRGCPASHLSLFSPPSADLRSWLLAFDVIYVGGGNTKSLLALWRDWGVDAILREAWENGTVLTGRSAGMICWFEQGITDSIPGDLTALDCLGWLPGTACPHYTGEPKRRPSFHQLLADGKLRPGLAADDGAALVYVGTELEGAVSEVDGATAYRLEKTTSGVVETPLDARRV